jgi:hypothetical protein
VLGFKLLSVTLKSLNLMIYAMSKSGDSNERFNLKFGSLPKPWAKRAPVLPKHSSAD